MKSPDAAPGRSLAIAMLAALAAIATVFPAQAGAYRLEPGQTTLVDTGERQQYTTITITNRAGAAGRLQLDAPVNRILDIPPGQSVELYGNYPRGRLSAVNTGQTPLEVITRYMETWRNP